MEAFGLLLHGFAVLLTWKTLALMMVGLVLGIFVDVLPGLGGPNGVAILLPLTFTMDPTSAIVMLSCIYWGALFGGAVVPMIVVSCAIGAYAIQNAMFDISLMLVFGLVGYVFKKIGIPLAPFTLALVLGSRAEDAFRLSMIGSGGDIKVFWSNGLVGSITTLALRLLFWPLVDAAFTQLGGLGRHTKNAKA
jgi:TctA family transporter